MFVPFLILIGIVAIAATSSSPKQITGAAPRALPPGVAPGAGPIATLNAYAQAGYAPPPGLVDCAIAEATVAGRHDYAHQIAHWYKPREAPVPQPQAVVHPVAVASASAPLPGTLPSAVAPAPVPGITTASDAEIQAMLDRNPRGFVDATTIAGAGAAPELATVRAEGRRAAPIPGVDGEAWAGFCTRLERQAPDFTSPRHVGMYRARRERLISLGIDPDRVLGSPAEQQAALEADLADAYGHVMESPLAEEIGRPVAVPGIEQPMEVTLSGVLGLAQVAGLEGAASWLESQGDRRRFPHTTEAFVKTNGIF